MKWLLVTALVLLAMVAVPAGALSTITTGGGGSGLESAIGAETVLSSTMSSNAFGVVYFANTSTTSKTVYGIYVSFLSLQFPSTYTIVGSAPDVAFFHLSVYFGPNIVIIPGLNATFYSNGVMKGNAVVYLYQNGILYLIWNSPIYTIYPGKYLNFSVYWTTYNGQTGYMVVTPFGNVFFYSAKVANATGWAINIQKNGIPLFSGGKLLYTFQYSSNYYFAPTLSPQAGSISADVVQLSNSAEQIWFYNGTQIKTTSTGVYWQYWLEFVNAQTSQVIIGL